MLKKLFLSILLIIFVTSPAFGFSLSTKTIKNLDIMGEWVNSDKTGFTLPGTLTAETIIANTELQINSGTSLPATCTVGELFVDTDADTDGSLYICKSANSWKEVDDDGAGGGSAIVLDLADDGSNESTDITEIAITNDTNSIFTEPAADKLLIDVSTNWPTADTANAGDSATAFFSSGTIEEARIHADIARDSEVTAVIEDDTYGVGWDTDTTHAPSQNAVYDELNSIHTALDPIDTEAELEALLDLPDLQGAVTDAQVPNDITIDTATTATNVVITDNESTAEANAVPFVADADVDGNTSIGLESDGDFTYNPSTGTVSATEFSGGGSGLTSVDAATVTVSDDESTADAHEIVFTTDNSNLESDGDLTYNPSTGTLSATDVTIGGTSVSANPLTTAGDIIYSSDGSGTQARLGIGTANQVLQTNAGATAPEWTSTIGVSHLAEGIEWDDDGSAFDLLWNFALTADRTVTIPDRAFTMDNVTTSTTSNITGMLKADGSNVVAATAGTDFVHPTVEDGGITLTDDGFIKLDATPDGMDDGEYNGITIEGINHGETVTAIKCVFLAADGKVDIADADAAGEFPAIGLTVNGGNDTDAAIILTRGIVRDEDWTGLTVGGAVYLGDDGTGQITQTAPSTSGDCVQLVGRAISDSEIYFNFSGHYLEVE